MTGTLSATGCTDPTEAANAKGVLAQSQLDAGQLAEARTTIAAAVAERDDIAALHLLRARIEMQANSTATAYSAFNAALALDSANPDALLGVAQLGLQLGHLGESEDATNRILALDPRQPNALVLRGLHDIIQRRYADAVANADTLLALSPGDENATILKARALALLDKPDEAFAIVEAARKSTGDTLGVVLTLLELNRLRGDGQAMVPLLKRVRQLQPKETEYLIDEADTLYKLGDPTRARRILLDRLLDPRLDDQTATDIAALLREYDPAALDSRLAEFTAKAGLPAKKAVARLYLDRNDPLRAEAALARAPAIDDVVALRALARVAQGKVDESLAQAESILAKDQTHCDALIVKAQVLLAKRRLDEAIGAATMATTTCPQMPAAHLTLVRAHEANGNQAGAMVAFRDAFDRNDQDSALVRAYTAWLERQGQGTRAVGLARRLTRNTPSLLSGWKLYVELCTRHPAEKCLGDAEAGLARAHKRFGVDPRSDKSPPTGLFGRLLRS